MKNNDLKKTCKGLLLFLAALSLWACNSKEVQQVPYTKAVKGTFYIDIYEVGEIEAVNSTNISSPNISWRYGNLKITQIVKDGTEVNKGDTLIVFDPSEVNKGIVEAEGSLEISRAELEKLMAQHQSDLEELNADYEITKLSHQISKIKFESAVYESDISKKEIELNLEKADIALGRAKEQIDNRIKIQREEVKQKNLSIEQNLMRLNEAHETLAMLFLISPSPGIAIVSMNWSSGNKFQIGDQSWSGFPLIQLPDLSSLKATAKINEVDIAKISKGLKVEIKPDAFSDSIFTGRVNAVANLAVNKSRDSRVKVFPVEILINETNKNLLPGLTVSCRLIIDQIDDVLYVPIEAVNIEGDKNFVYRKSGNGYNKVEVEVGTSNSNYTIITKGLSEKDEVALSVPFEEEETNKKAAEKV